MREFDCIIVEQARHMHRLIRDLHDAGGIDSGRLLADREPSEGPSRCGGLVGGG